MFYAGDGVSDLSAAKETDLLFAKKGHGIFLSSPFLEIPYLLLLDLIVYCVRENVPFTVFEDWSSILSTVQAIAAGKTTVQEVSAAGVKDFNEAGSKPSLSLGNAD